MALRLTWHLDDVAGDRVIASLHGELLGVVPSSLGRALGERAARATTLVVDVTDLDRVDTPGVASLRTAVAPFARVRVRLPVEQTAAAHLLREGFAGVADFDPAPDAVANERRRHRRYVARIAARIELRDGALLTGTTLDVSRGGAHVVLDEDSARSRMSVHDSAGGCVRVELPTLGLAWRAAAIVAGDARDIHLAFAEPFVDLFVA